MFCSAFVTVSSMLFFLRKAEKPESSPRRCHFDPIYFVDLPGQLRLEHHSMPPKFYYSLQNQQGVVQLQSLSQH